MKTSDKELDDLFTSRLQHLEVEPTANLWPTIGAELNGKTKKKDTFSILRAAAGIIIVLSLAWLFLSKDELVKTNHQPKIAKVILQKNNPTISQITNLDDKNSMVLLSAKNKVIKEVLPKKVRNKIVFVKPRIRQKAETEPVSTQITVQVKPAEEQQFIVQNNSIQTRTTLVPDASISLKPQPETAVSQKVIVKPQVLVLVNNSVKTKHKRIRNIGDIVNLVIAKVDKREDKLIQFSDEDDGEESNVTGINLGFVSLKKEK